MKKIEIYTTNYCPFCVKAKSLLNKKKIKFFEINVYNDEAFREKMCMLLNPKRINTENTHVLIYKSPDPTCWPSITPPPYTHKACPYLVIVGSMFNKDPLAPFPFPV